MKPIVALALLAAMTVPTFASTPESWAELDRAAAEACIAASGFEDATTTTPVSFSDDVGQTALLVTGTYPQAHMNGATGTMLCLYDRAGETAETVEVTDWPASQ